MTAARDPWSRQTTRRQRRSQSRRASWDRAMPKGTHIVRSEARWSTSGTAPIGAPLVGPEYAIHSALKDHAGAFHAMGRPNETNVSVKWYGSTAHEKRRHRSIGCQGMPSRPLRLTSWTAQRCAEGIPARCDERRTVWATRTNHNLRSRCIRSVSGTISRKCNPSPPYPNGRKV
jgi:hypothetical protein